MPTTPPGPSNPADTARVAFDEWRHWFEVALSGAALDASATTDIDADAARIVSRADAIATRAVQLIEGRAEGLKRGAPGIQLPTPKLG